MRTQTILLCLAGISPALCAQQLHFGADSRYVTEGRNNLVSGGLAWTGYDVDIAGITFAAWHARGTGSHYRESQLAVSYAHNLLETVQLRGGVNTVDFEDSITSDSDVEISAALVITRGKFETLIETVYSRQFNGAYLTLAQSVTVLPNTSAFVKLGSNAGYVGGESRGLNNAEIGLSGSRPLNQMLSLKWLVGQTFAIGPRDGDTLGDHLWVSLSLSAQF